MEEILRDREIQARLAYLGTVPAGWIENVIATPVLAWIQPLLLVSQMESDKTSYYYIEDFHRRDGTAGPERKRI
jgi:hypothetical protein